MEENEFLELYAKVVLKATELLIRKNEICGEDWPAGQQWDQLGGSSKAIFMKEAREELLIDNDRFLARVRHWPYSDAGMATLEKLFGCPDA